MTPCAVCASRPQTATPTSRTPTSTTIPETTTIGPNSWAPVTSVPCAPPVESYYSQLRECCERLGHGCIVRSDNNNNDASDTKYNVRRKAGAVATPAQSCCWREVDGVKLVVSESAPELSPASVISSSVRIVELTRDSQRINKYKMDTSASCCSRSSEIPTSSTSATTTIVVPRSHLAHDHHCHHCHHREERTSSPSLLLQSSTSPSSSPSSTSSSTTCSTCASSCVSYDHHLHHNPREQHQRQEMSTSCPVSRFQSNFESTQELAELEQLHNSTAQLSSDESSRNSSVRHQSCRSRTSRTVAQWSLIPCIVLLALATTTTDACSTRSTPKAHSKYISQLHQQQQPQQYPRPVPHYPPLLPRHPSPIQDTPTPSQTVPARAPYSQQQQSAQPQQDQQQISQQPQKSQLIPSVPTVSDADLTTQRPNVTFRTYPCPEAYAKWYCLNGAHCFSVKIGESVLYNCECADGYMGQRCEFKDPDGTYIQRRGILIQTASLSLIIVFVVIIIILCVVHSMRQQQLNSKTGQYVYRDWSAVITTKQVPVTVLTPDILERTA